LFLQQVIQYLETNPYGRNLAVAAFTTLATFPYKFTQKALKSHVEGFVIILQLSKELALKVKNQEVEHLANAITYKQIGTLVSLNKKYRCQQIDSLIFESNQVRQNYEIHTPAIKFQDTVLIPLETRWEFIEVGLALKACTGSACHWEDVKNLQALRFKVVRNGNIVGTVLYKQGRAYGFEKGYVNYSEATIKAISATIMPHIGNAKVSNLSLFKYETHGWGKGLTSLCLKENSAT
jgi:hypothetical protein